ncbi:L-aspartate oxidase [Nakamurella flavida]|uniref:L-aspartate oxidase n=1 Tax=Nakamurella flavida TaxID=363630 RepID=A0A938YN49_9ACTN|nr:L-aspartate oxidase [Nakamurella flavida]MBM9476108.1 L-aspartate oxidase [Nakamurella flavida]MDP9777147.1 L-aspartate oxidase [Nakamurella flavida]
MTTPDPAAVIDAAEWAETLLPAWEATADVVVVGTGVAGLTTAFDLIAAGRSVLVVTKGEPDEGSTTWAQGGVAVVLDQVADRPGVDGAPAEDSVPAHLRDTLEAGGGLVDPDAAARILIDGPGAVDRLIARGARFDVGPGGLLRTREGGHHADRIIHAGGDATGAEIERALLAGIDTGPAVLTDHLALDVVLDGSGRAGGLSVLAPDGSVGLIRARAVVLATGGAGHLYAATTNPPVATGDGLAMALRAGAELADAEFVQFHPTVLFTAGGGRGRRPLVTEAVRGAGAVLVDVDGARIMPGVHPLADLAPRDVVSLAVTRRMTGTDGAGAAPADHVLLDATGIDGAEFRRRFPTVTAACLAAGIDPRVDPIPVAPAAHYSCGGVRTDLDGRTSVPGLFAVGEVARTGLHGANRLASNSLLEGLVMGERTAEAVNAAVLASRVWNPSDAELVLTRAPGADPAGLEALQNAMSRWAGIGRDAAGLAAADAVAADTARRTPVVTDRAAVQTANLALAARALLAAAAARTESRGAHVRVDFPATDAAQARSSTVRLVDGELRVSTDRVADGSSDVLVTR